MKNIFLLSLLASFSTSVYASEGSVLLQKTVTSGFVPSSAVKLYNCKIFQDGVVIEQSIGGVKFRTVKNVFVSRDIHKTIAAAAEGTISTVRGPTDVGFTTYFLPSKEGKSSGVILKQSGEANVTNSAPEANTLVQIIDELCR